LCNFLHSPVTSSLLGPYIRLRTLFWNTLSLCSALMWETKFHTHTKQAAELRPIYLKQALFTSVHPWIIYVINLYRQGFFLNA
jgi:hypothetical protein